MKTVLVVDDMPSEVALMGAVVQQLGHQVISGNDGDECLALARAHRPDLILLDVVMPNVDGFQTCRKLKKDGSTAQIPVVMVTSKNAETDQFWARKQGADGFVSKPFTPDSLAAAIKPFLD